MTGSNPPGPGPFDSPKQGADAARADHGKTVAHCLTLANLVPVPDWIDVSPVPCAVCGEPLTPDVTGNYFTAIAPWWVCDPCGDRIAPNLAPLLRRLRQPGRFTVTTGGATMPQDEIAAICPACDLPVDRDALTGWRVVSSVTGRPICDDCLLDVDPQVVTLAASLAALSRRAVPR